MPRTRKRLVYTEQELDDAMVERATAMGVSVNEWMNRVFENALASKGIKITYTHRTEVEL